MPTWPLQEPMSEDEVARIERELAQQNAQADRQEAIRERREELLRQVWHRASPFVHACSGNRTGRQERWGPDACECL